MLSRLFAVFALSGVLVALFPEAMEPWLSESEELFGPRPADFRLLMGILGGSMFGKWVAASLIARVHETWADRALWAGLWVWFVVEAGVCAWHGASFQIWLASFPPLVVVSFLLWQRDNVFSRFGTWNLLALVCVANGVGGLLMAVGIHSVLFEPWTGRVDASMPWIAFLFGPIGGTIAAHFVMLVPAARRGHWGIVLGSVLAWFLLDSAVSISEGAWFNVWMINAPCLALVVVATLWSARAPR